MNSVKDLTIVLVDFEVVFGPGEDENNITCEMRQAWDKSFSLIENILADSGFTPENCSLTRDEHLMDIVSESDVNFEDAVSLLHALEEHFAITEFRFVPEEDDYYEEPPHAWYAIHNKDE